MGGFVSSNLNVCVGLIPLKYIQICAKWPCLVHNYVPNYKYLLLEHEYFMLLNTAVVLAGKPATGKTAALNTVVAAFNADQESSAANVKLVRVFPQALEESSDIFGCVNFATGDWEDGIFTSIFRKAHKVRVYRLRYIATVAWPGHNPAYKYNLCYTIICFERE